ncbi:hypothetical protein BB559_000026 [Furculomyces boomerangus]|uniref:beta-glucosidase n=1 Tax=Furculomyces boomerangus TaxID=61424 RepID=A0A2T9Z6K8_9FUNG|nr:hypothetical protein BB559_000648 [Furculomyces boomerangus]PVV00223.1 hypothetical protein BB559_000026 [Furculomyces boomerangus]
MMNLGLVSIGFLCILNSSTLGDISGSANQSNNLRYKGQRRSVPKFPLINVDGVKSNNGVVCLPDNYPFQDYDPMELKSVKTYSLKQYDESVPQGPSLIPEVDTVRILKKLSLQEKVGQMVHVHIGKFLGCDGLLNVTLAESIFEKYKIGGVYGSPVDMGGRWNIASPQRWANLTNTLQKIAMEKGSKLPFIYSLESPKGAGNIKGSILFPAPVNIGATFNLMHAYIPSQIVAKDIRAAGAHMIHSPSANLNVNRLWKHNYESFGEDPYLAGEMVYTTVRGLQGNYKVDRNRVAACVKHYIGYSGSKNGDDKEPRNIPYHKITEYHLYPFLRGFNAGATTAMLSPNTLNGEAVSSSRYLKNDILRNFLRFSGVVVSDWSEIKSMVKFGTAISPNWGIYQSFEDGVIDVSMSSDGFDFIDGIFDMLNRNAFSKDKIYTSVGRILQLKNDLGLFDNPYSNLGLIETVGSNQDIEKSQIAARESIILLKNENRVLPFHKNDKVVFIGPIFNSTRYMCGGWSVHRKEKSDLEGDSPYYGYGDTLEQAIEKIIGRKPTIFTGFDIDGNLVDDYTELGRHVHRADKVVIGFGEKSAGEANMLDLTESQISLVEYLAKLTSTPIVFLLMQNTPRIIDGIIKYADGILNVNLPGAYGGLPIAEAIYGSFSPSGRMPYTYPKSNLQTDLTYYTPVTSEYDPTFAFGTGFGYNEMVYSSIRVSNDVLFPGIPIKVTVSVTNNGNGPQLEPVLLYASQHVRNRMTPERYRLKDFKKKLINPKETVEYVFHLKAEQFQFRASDSQLYIEGGKITLTINAFTKNVVTKDVLLKIDLDFTDNQQITTGRDNKQSPQGRISNKRPTPHY